MSRYIDADELLKEAEKDGAYGYVSAKQIADFPTADVVEVVRCKDCRYHENEQIGMVYCPAVVGGWVDDNWFCKGGEKMDEVSK